MRARRLEDEQHMLQESDTETEIKIEIEIEIGEGTEDDG